MPKKSLADQLPMPPPPKSRQELKRRLDALIHSRRWVPIGKGDGAHGQACEREVGITPGNKHCSDSYGAELKVISCGWSVRRRWVNKPGSLITLCHQNPESPSVADIINTYGQDPEPGENLGFRHTTSPSSLYFDVIHEGNFIICRPKPRVPIRLADGSACIPWDPTTSPPRAPRWLTDEVESQLHQKLRLVYLVYCVKQDTGVPNAAGSTCEAMYTGYRTLSGIAGAAKLFELMTSYILKLDFDFKLPTRIVAGKDHNAKFRIDHNHLHHLWREYRETFGECYPVDDVEKKARKPNDLLAPIMPTVKYKRSKAPSPVLIPTASLSTPRVVEDDYEDADMWGAFDGL